MKACHDEELPMSPTPVHVGLPNRPQVYHEPSYEVSAAPAATQYAVESSTPRNMSWMKGEPIPYELAQITHVDSHSSSSNGYPDVQLQYPVYYDGSAEKHYSAPEMSPYYEGYIEAMRQEPTLTEYAAQSESNLSPLNLHFSYIGSSGTSLPSVVHHFTQSPRLDSDNIPQEQQPGSPASVFSAHSQ